MKNTLLNFLLLGVDAGVSAYKNMEQEQIDDLSLFNNVKRTSDRVKTIFNDLFEYILQPMYSPQHPYGNCLMKQAEKDFEELTQKNPK